MTTEETTAAVAAVAAEAAVAEETLVAAAAETATVEVAVAEKKFFKVAEGVDVEEDVIRNILTNIEPFAPLLISLQANKVDEFDTETQRLRDAVFGKSEPLSKEKVEQTLRELSAKHGAFDVTPEAFQEALKMAKNPEAAFKIAIGEVQMHKRKLALVSTGKRATVTDPDRPPKQLGETSVEYLRRIGKLT